MDPEVDPEGSAWHPIPFIFWFDFLVIIWLFFDRLPLGPGPCKCFSTSSPTMSTIPQFFYDFLGILWLFLDRLPYWAQDPENVTHHHHHHPPNFWLFLNRLPYFRPGPWTLNPANVTHHTRGKSWGSWTPTALDTFDGQLSFRLPVTAWQTMCRGFCWFLTMSFTFTITWLM